MDIGTAKPDAAARARVPHHLIDIIDPVEAYSAARFRADAMRCDRRHPVARRRSAARRRDDALLQGAAGRAFRAAGRRSGGARAARRPRRRGRLARAARRARARRSRDRRHASSSTDAQRIQRALEVYEIAGRPLSRAAGRAGRRDGVPGRTIAVALVPADRAALHRAIAARFDAMLAAGLVAEVAGAARAPCADARPAVDALRRLPAGVGISRRPHRRRHAPRERHRGDAAAGQAPVHVAPRDAGDRVRAVGAASRRRGGGPPVARGARAAPDSRLLLCNNPRFPIAAAGVSRSRTAGHARAHALRQVVGQPRRPRRGRRHGAALHRPPPGARGDEPAGVRGPEARRPQAVAHRVDRRHGRSQHADARTGTRASAIPSRACRSRRSTPTSARTAPRPISRSATGGRASST